MTEQAKNARREYKRQWNKANADKVKAAQDRYWMKKAQEAAQEKQQPQHGNEVITVGN